MQFTSSTLLVALLAVSPFTTLTYAQQVSNLRGARQLEEDGTAATTTQRSTKCGVATTLLNDQVLKELDDAGGLAFYTGWNSQPKLSLDPSSTGMKFVSWANTPDGNWNGPPTGGSISTLLLGVNEPDGDTSGGSDPIGPEAYADLWPGIVDNARNKGYTEFAGPQLASSIHDPSHPGKGLDWQVRFMTKLDQKLDALGVDDNDKSNYLTYVSYHVYEPNCNGDPKFIVNTFYQDEMNAWKAALAQWWTKYEIEGFVLSEFAGSPASEQCDVDGQMKMARDVLPLVLGMQDVKHVAWFSAPSMGRDINNNAQYLWNENSLTEVGKEYLKTCSRY